MQTTVSSQVLSVRRGKMHRRATGAETPVLVEKMQDGAPTYEEVATCPPNPTWAMCRPVVCLQFCCVAGAAAARKGHPDAGIAAAPIPLMGPQSFDHGQPSSVSLCPC